MIATPRTVEETPAHAPKSAPGALAVEAALEQAAERIRAASFIVVSSHVNPDGDAIGSILGTALTLRAAGTRVLPINPDPVPWTFQKLPEAVLVQQWSALPAAGKPDLWLALDTADRARLGLPPELEELLADVPIIQFDHHVTNTRYGGLNIIQPSAAACCEQMAAFLLGAGLPVTPDAATCLLCGLTTDSGSFRFGTVSGGTFRAAGALVDAGGRQQEVGELLGLRRFTATLLWGLTLTTMEQHLGGRLVEAHVTQAMFRSVGLNEEGTEGVVETMRAIEGVDIAVLFREEPSGEIKVSLRTTEVADATVIAVANGGGGHPRAAGCTIPGPLATARERVLGQATRLLETGTLA